MTKVRRLKSIAEYHKMKGLPAPDHPLISVFDYDSVDCFGESGADHLVFDFYHISIKRVEGARFKYGQKDYDFSNGVMFFIAPNQVFGIEKIAEIAQPRSGWLLMIHPDFLWKTSLARTIRKYDFFNYDVNEALFLSEKEQATLLTIVKNIEQEYRNNIDRFSQNIIISQIETLLNYSERFYQRQFITRSKNTHQVLDEVEKALEQYFSENEENSGLPGVQYLADKVNLSPVYLSALLKSLTGQTAQQHIHEKLIEKAKEKLSTTELSISEIAYALGFEYSQSFSKLFKNKVGLSPQEFRAGFQ